MRAVPRARRRLLGVAATALAGVALVRGEARRARRLTHQVPLQLDVLVRDLAPRPVSPAPTVAA